MTDRRILTSLFVAGAITIGGLAAVSTPAPTSRPATMAEASYCTAHEAPGSGDCNTVGLLGGAIQEDDPWGRWNCATMGDKVCGAGR